MGYRAGTNLLTNLLTFRLTLPEADRRMVYELYDLTDEEIKNRIMGTVLILYIRFNLVNEYEY